MKNKYLLICVLVLLSSILRANTISSESSYQFKGYAYSQKDRALLYSEHHMMELDEQGKLTHSEVFYYSSTGKLMAKKYLNYHESGYLPDFEYTNLFSNQGFKVSASDNDITILIKQNGQESEKIVETINQKPLIVDAGFDVFMRENWPDLLAGKKKIVEFLSPTRAMFITFEIQRIESILDESAENQTVAFQLSPKNFIISLLVDPIDLKYHKQTGRIMSYQGLTNIERIDDPDQNYVADIEYVYEF